MGVKKCIYCKREEKMVPITFGRFNENICLDCKRELIKSRKDCQKIIDEVIHDMEHLFSHAWDKHIRLKECATIEMLNFKWKIPAFLRRLWEKYWNIVWEASIEPNVMRIKWKLGKKVCTFMVRMDTPKGIIIAETVHAIIKDYLKPEVECRNLNEKWADGLALWYAIHYLYNMDYRIYADGYDMIIREWEQERNGTYIVLYEKKHPANKKMMPLSWEIGQMSDHS